MIAESIVCNNCQKLLGGRDRAALVTEDHVYVMGKIAMEKWSQIEQRFNFSYLTRIAAGNSPEPLHFCNGKCLGEWVDAGISRKKDSYLKD